MKIITERKLVGSHVSILELCDQVIDLNYSNRRSQPDNLVMLCKFFCVYSYKRNQFLKK